MTTETDTAVVSDNHGARRRRRGLFVAAIVGGAGLLFVAMASALSLVYKDRGATKVASLLVGHPAPQLSGDTVGGGHASLIQYRGRWVIVNFFASWCVPCQQETPELLRFASDHRGPQDPAILGVVYMDDDDSVRSFIHAHGATWPLLGYRTAAAADAYGVSGIPVTFLVSPDGRITTKAVGGLRLGQLDSLLAEARRGGRSASGKQ